MTILKEEINDAMAAVLDLVKWKLAVLAVLTGVGLGVLHDLNRFEHGYLLLFLAPYVCVYIDLLVYEREARIHHIARYLRDYAGSDPETLEIHRYEMAIQARRRLRKDWVTHENGARLFSSVVAGIGIPLLSLLVGAYRAQLTGRSALFLIPGVGVGLIVYAYVNLQRQLHRLDAPAPGPAASPVHEHDLTKAP